MTGRYAANVGLSMAMVPGNPVGLSPDYTILPEHLTIGATTPSVYFFFDFLKGEVLPKCDSTRRRRIAKKIVDVLFTNMKCSFIGGLFSTADHGSSRGIFKGSV